MFGLTNKIGWSLIPRQLCTLVHDNVVKQLKAKCVPFRIQCCASAVNAQNIHDLQKVWQKVSSISFPYQYRELDNIDGEPVVFEWEISSGAQHWSFSRKSKN